jgi:hypothetical protein
MSNQGEKSSLITIIKDYLMNTSSYEESPKHYYSELRRALLILSESEKTESRIIAGEEELKKLREVVIYSLERITGFNIYVTEKNKYRGKLGISPSIAKVYRLRDGDRVRIENTLEFIVKIEGKLSEFTSLLMYKDDATILFGSKAEKGVIRGAKISIYL